MTVTGSSDLDRWVRDYVADGIAEPNVEAFARHVDGQILDQIPELAADPVLAADLRSSTRSQWRAFLAGLDREVQNVVLPPQAVDLALSIARRGLDLGILLKVYRVASDATWEFIIETTDALPPDGPDHADALKFLWGRAGRWINESVDQLILTHIAERESALHGTLARRSEAIRALLRGDPMPIDLATQEIGHQLRFHQTALALWFDEAPFDQSPAQLDALAQMIASELGASRPLTLAAGRRELWAWVGTRAEPAVDRLAELVTEPGIRVAVGRPAPGITGFISSHREALDTQRCVVTSGNPSVVTQYADVELACLVAGNVEGANALVERELGRLAVNDPTLNVIRETLAHYLRTGSNAVTTASALYVHRNTVRHRLTQAEELVGHPLTERRTEMDLALRYRAWQPRGA